MLDLLAIWVSLGHSHRALACTLAKIGLTIDDTQRARARAVQAHLPVTVADLGVATRRRVDRDLVVLHRAIEQSGQIAGHDVFHAAAEAAHPEAGGAASLDSVAAIVSIFGANLKKLKSKEKHKIEDTNFSNCRIVYKI